jgi:hypothetical protein
MRQLIKIYYKAVEVAKEIQLGLDTDTVTRMDGLGKVNG